LTSFKSTKSSTNQLSRDEVESFNDEMNMKSGWEVS
jgi:hypothetical protein